MGTFDDMAAAAADLHPVVAAPIEKKERLFACFEPFFEPIEQLFRKMGEAAGAFRRLCFMSTIFTVGSWRCSGARV